MGARKLIAPPLRVWLVLTWTILAVAYFPRGTFRGYIDVVICSSLVLYGSKQR